MKSLKENWIVKTVYAYLDLILKLFPILVLIFLFEIIWKAVAIGRTTLEEIDYFKILSNNPALLNSSNIWLVLLILLMDVIILCSLYISLRKLTAFIKNVFEENPFIEENGKYLKFVGIITIILTFIYHLSKVISMPGISLPVSFFTNLLVKLSNLIGIIFNPFLIIGMFVFVIGEIIVHAAKLKQENDLTV
jgi:hypothetical protein